ncbi:AGAP013033-PA-like protein [Anopheles sinensis]|uniref:AGAP013033-PA-like protein n=1 Tax=Anopheles sinensis TaxID=74873 RepID=A0A084VRT9_ANOSI|nr:AGAP013033-PA-like protein [Anopheles sinensis]
MYEGDGDAFVEEKIAPHLMCGSLEDLPFEQGPVPDADEDDFYEEEMMLLVDFDMLLKLEEDPHPGNTHIKIIGLDSENPIIQVNDEVYRGTYESAFGTNVFFEPDVEQTTKLDPVFDKTIKQMYRYVGKTDKVLRMKRIFATLKDAVAEEGASTDDIPYESKYEVDRTYEEALNLHLPEGGFPPRRIHEMQNGASLIKQHVIAEPKIELGESPTEQ